MNNNHNGEFEIDILQLAKALLKRWWIIAASAVVCALVALVYASFFVPPQYVAKAMLYVNNGSQTSGASISTADISAAKNLVATYGVILSSDTTMDEVLKKTNLPYTASQVSKMVSSASVNSTEVLEISVKCENPDHAEIIANAIVEVLPGRITQILDGSSVNIVDYAKKPNGKVSPNIRNYVVSGFLVGVLISCCIIILFELLDDTIHSEEYLQQYPEIPVLAAIPDFHQKGSKKYGYYEKYGD